MRIKHVLLVVFLSILIFYAIAFAQQSAELLLQKGLYLEEIKGDLSKAIEIFEKIPNDFNSNRIVCAKAQLHLSFCYEKLGSKQTRQAYQKVIDTYSDQLELVATAKERLKKFTEPKINQLVKHYLERLPPDPMTSISFDGKYRAYTDWRSGNIATKNIQTGKVRILTDADWPKSVEFAYHPIWSRDGKYIAYSWYKNRSTIELRVVDVNTRKTKFIYSDNNLVIFPQDWSPDNKTILCETFTNMFLNKVPKYHRLTFISITGNVNNLATLSTYTRGMKFSPDGKYLTYDLRTKSEGRHVFIYHIEDSTQYQITSGVTDDVGYDNPAWSSDGKLLFYRDRSRGRYDLWAVPVRVGQPSGSAYIIHSDIIGELLSMRGVNESEMLKPDQNHTKPDFFDGNKSSNYEFVEEFSSPTLNDSWTVYEWNKANVYDYNSFGRYSLSDQLGSLRYYLDPAMISGFPSNYLPGFDGWWFWYYPALEISRPLRGDRWLLETRVTYSMVTGLNSRSFVLKIFLDPMKNKNTTLSITRSKIDNDFQMMLATTLKNFAKNESCLSPLDTLGITNFTYRYRIMRLDSLFRVDLSDDNLTFRTALVGTVPSDLLSAEQLLMLTGSSWFVPAGSYADWDYFRFRQLDEMEVETLKRETLSFQSIQKQ